MKRLLIAECIFGILNHIGNGIYCRCPGDSKHTHPTRDRDCRIYGIERGAPTVYCCHSSCKADIDAANDRFRKSVANQEYRGPRITPSEKTEGLWTPPTYAKTVELAALEAEQSAIEAEEAIPTIARDYAWAFEDSADIPSDPNDQYDAFLQLWDPQDWLWIGDNRWSGEWASYAWGTTEQWLRRGPSIQAVQTSFCSYKTGAMARTNANVLERRYLVFECDSHPKGTQAAIINWLRRQSGLGLSLRMVCDTGGKSLHAWFHASTLSPTDLVQLKSIMTGSPVAIRTPLDKPTKHGWHPGLGGDPAMFVLSQPVRLPGPTRPGTERPQRIVWLAPAESSSKTN